MGGASNAKNYKGPGMCRSAWGRLKNCRTCRKSVCSFVGCHVRRCSHQTSWDILGFDWPNVCVILVAFLWWASTELQNTATLGPKRLTGGLRQTDISRSKRTLNVQLVSGYSKKRAVERRAYVFSMYLLAILGHRSRRQETTGILNE